MTAATATIALERRPRKNLYTTRPQPGPQRPASVSHLPAHTLPAPNKQQNLWKDLDISWDFAHHRQAASADDFLFPNPTSKTVTYLPDPKLWSRALAAALVEVLCGKRPASQLERWVASEIFTALERRVELSRRLDGDPPRGLPPKVLSSRICVVSGSVVETTHCVTTTNKTFATCIRLEARRNRWIVTAVEIL